MCVYHCILCVNLSHTHTHIGPPKKNYKKNETKVKSSKKKWFGPFSLYFFGASHMTWFQEGKKHHALIPKKKEKKKRKSSSKKNKGKMNQCKDIYIHIYTHLKNKTKKENVVFGRFHCLWSSFWGGGGGGILKNQKTIALQHKE